MKEKLIDRSPNLLFAFGAFATLFGLFLAFWPGISIVTFVTIWGVYALIDGATALFAALKASTGRILLIITGVIGVGAGLTVLLRPGIGIASLAWVLAFWLFFRGLSEFVVALSTDGLVDKLLVALGGMLWFLASYFVFVNPAEAALTLTLVFGMLMIGWGVLFFVTGYRLKHTLAGTN